MSHRRRLGQVSAPQEKEALPSKGKTVHQLKVTLLGTDPPVWRRLLVPSDWDLDDLHEALQRTMGWEDCHVYGFQIGKRKWCMPRETSGIDAMHIGLFTPHPNAYTDTVRLDRAAPKKGDSFVYVYDLGDQWEHDILVEDVVPRTRETKAPWCLGGDRACPPEDCGGTGGYEDIVKALADPKYNPERQDRDELMEWLPEEYDPGQFDLDEVNERLSG
ncbi:MAG: plasmid pRiA4b ORF-3 family protein [Thermoplasmata archaeon]